MPLHEPSDGYCDDIEVKRLMIEAESRAAAILRDHPTGLEALVRLLLEREVVDGDEARKILEAHAVRPRCATSA